MLHSPCPMVVTLHDLVRAEAAQRAPATGVRLRLRQLAVQRAARVIVPTEALAQDALARLGLERERIDVIPEAPGRDACTRAPPREVAAVRARFALPERYLLWVGGLQHPDPAQARRQARRHAARAAARARRPDQPVGARAAGRDPHRATSPTSDLAALYSGAHALVRRLRGRGLRPAGRRGAGLRHAGRRLRGARRCARCSTGAPRSCRRAICRR